MQLYLKAAILYEMTATGLFKVTEGHGFWYSKAYMWLPVSE